MPLPICGSFAQPEQLAYYYRLWSPGRGRVSHQALETLLQRYPDHAPSCELGSLLMSAQRYRGRNQPGKAVRLNQKSVKANYQLGLLLTRMGKGRRRTNGSRLPGASQGTMQRTRVYSFV
jgi:hypothetical protein